MLKTRKQVQISSTKEYGTILLNLPLAVALDHVKPQVHNLLYFFAVGPEQGLWFEFSQSAGVSSNSIH